MNIPRLSSTWAFDGAKLSALMLERGYSRADLGAAIGRTHEAVRQYEIGLADPPIYVLGDIALVLGVDPGALFVRRRGRPAHTKKRGRKLVGPTLRQRAAALRA
jgi:transcriptional regulator with XRE-family HTH domain